MPAVFLPLSSGETASVGGHEAEGLAIWLAPVGDAAMAARIGTETVITRRLDTCGTWLHTRATRYRTSRPHEWLEGHRYLLLAADGVTPVGVVNVTLRHPPAGGTQARVSNAFVAPRYRRQGVARALLLLAQKDHPQLCADSPLTEMGAALTGHAIAASTPPLPSRSLKP